jgi:hypothetical protein
MIRPHLEADLAFLNKPCTVKHVYLSVFGPGNGTKLIVVFENNDTSQFDFFS